MIEIKTANEGDAALLALLGRVTYAESHGHFIDNKNDLQAYLNTAFSLSKTEQDIREPNNLFYIMYADGLPVGYAKLELNAPHKNVRSASACQLERIYVLNDFIPTKIGIQLFTFVENKARELGSDAMWLSVYKENKRAIRFYQKNVFEEVGLSRFIVNGVGYENMVLSKKL